VKKELIICALLAGFASAAMSDWRNTKTMGVGASDIRAAKAECESSGRQNITQKSPRHMYQVTINKVYLGSFKTEQEAVTVRDEYRKRNGMPSADY